MHVRTRRSRRARIGLVAPALDNGGGVATVAEFVCDAIERSGSFDLTLVSLPLSARDPLGVGLTRPASWLRGVQTAESVWQGRRFVSVGAIGCELEFQRYRLRPALRRALADCDLIQVVTGLPAPAHGVCGLGKPVAVFCATRARWSAYRAHRTERGPGEVWRRAMTIIIDRRSPRAAAGGCDSGDEPVDGRNARGQPAATKRSASSSRASTRRASHPPAIAIVMRSPHPLRGTAERSAQERRAAAAGVALLAARVPKPVRLVLAGVRAPSADFWRQVAISGCAMP